jgi:hypothetical protein
MSSIIAQLAGDEGAIVKLVRMAQHADATPMLQQRSLRAAALASNRPDGVIPPEEEFTTDIR